MTNATYSKYKTNKSDSIKINFEDESMLIVVVYEWLKSRYFWVSENDYNKLII